MQNEEMERENGQFRDISVYGVPYLDAACSVQPQSDKLLVRNYKKVKLYF